MRDYIEVVDYDIATLAALLSQHSCALEHVVDAKLHRRYFRDYFEELGARTIVVEKHYVDRDFLEDFAAYYVRCFNNYKRTCARLHFFRTAFSDSDLESLLRGEQTPISAQQLNDEYLGFVVIKPLPRTIVGRTCLSTYPEEGVRCFPTCREYEANLCGIPLTVRTVAFQEQDTVVAACATSALWSIFQCTGTLFGHAVPSPVEITKAASERTSVDTRMLPNTGLTMVQMAEAIRNLPLEPFLVGANDLHVLQATVYAYLRARIPVILGIELYGANGGSDPVLEGYHAVAATGFRLGDPAPEKDPKSDLLLRSRAVSTIYAHDDQVGPFARMEFVWGDEPYLTTSWNYHWDGKYDTVRAAPQSVLIPLYHKIRIPFNAIHDTLVPLDKFIDQLRQHSLVQLNERIEWDIYLVTTNDFKNQITEHTLPLDNSTRLEILTQPLPRFMWRAVAFDNDRPVLELLFDATDIEQGSYVVFVIEHDPTLTTVLRSIGEDPDFESEFRRYSAWQIFEWLLKR